MKALWGLAVCALLFGCAAKAGGVTEAALEPGEATQLVIKAIRASEHADLECRKLLYYRLNWTEVRMPLDRQVMRVSWHSEHMPTRAWFEVYEGIRTIRQIPIDREYYQRLRRQYAEDYVDSLIATEPHCF